jgi:CDP-glucose 4,6-dehydratase
MAEYWHGRRVLITGGTGFLGGWLTDALVQLGAEVVLLVRDQVPGCLVELLGLDRRVLAIASGSVEDLNLVSRVLTEYRIDTCLHLAAQAIVGVANKSPLSTFETNIRGTWNVLEACRLVGVSKVVVASSDKAYGEQESLPYTEGSALLGCYPYDASKACADILSKTYARTYDLNVVTTRCANLYGGGDLNFSRVVPETIRSILRGQNPIIRSDGTPQRDYLYTKDAVRGYLALAEQASRPEIRGLAFNFGTGRPLSVLDLVRMIIRLSGNDALRPNILGERGKGSIQSQYLSSTRADKLLGWHPEYDIETGMRETLDWYGSYFKRLAHENVKP